MSRVGRALAQMTHQSGQAGLAMGPAMRMVMQAQRNPSDVMGLGDASLPRDPSVYEGIFGPLMPMRPFGIDPAAPGHERPEPRLWEYPVGWNLPSAPDTFRPVSFKALKEYAGQFPIASIAKWTRINEIVNLEWDMIVDDAVVNDAGPDAFATEREATREFWHQPDRNYDTIRDWLVVLLNYLLDYDTICLYPSPALGRGRLLQSGIADIEPLDPATIRPLLDIRGGRPIPPNPAYQQYIYGVPRVDLMTLMQLQQRDMQSGGPRGAGATFDADQLVYRRSYPRGDTPFGFSCTERAIQYLVAGARRIEWMLTYFDQGSVPAGFMTTPMGSAWTMQQIEERERWLNQTVAADLANKWRIKLVPEGSKFEPMKQPILSDVFDKFLIDVTCAAYDVTPTELGFPNAAGLGGKGFAEEQEDVQYRKSLIPTANFLESIINHLNWNVLGVPRALRFHFTALDPVEDAALKAQIDNQLFAIGGVTIDEMRESRGKEAYGYKESSLPWVITRMGAILLTEDGPELIGAPPKGSVQAPDAVPGSDPTAVMASDAEDAADEEDDTQRQMVGTAGQTVAAKAVVTELRDLKRFLDRRGWRPGRAFQGKLLSAATVADASRSPDALAWRLKVAEADASGKATVDQQADAAALTLAALLRRGAHTGTPREVVADQALHTGSTLDQATQALGDLYQRAYEAGAATWEADVPAGDNTGLVLANAKRQWLADFLQDAPSMRSKAVQARAKQYTATAHTAYQRGRVKYAPDGTAWRWSAAVDACALCADRDGQVYTEATLPCYPGDSGYGDYCAGGPRCRCDLEPVSPRDVD